MDQDKRYTVMELAELIGVPRTTINDWLNRYSQFIDSIPQGRRKVYPESAAEVLKEIASLRNTGKTFTEIESELSASHPIHPVPIPPRTEIPEKEKMESASVNGKTEKLISDKIQINPQYSSNTEFAMIAAKQSEEIGRLIGDSFRNMDTRIRELETLSAAQRKMSNFWLGAFFLFLIVLICGGILSCLFINRTHRENARLQRQQLQNTEKLTLLKEQSVTLIAGTKTFQANITRLENELKQQKKQFDENMKAENKRLNELHRTKENLLLSERDHARAQLKEQEMRLALEKEKFAAERLKLLKELEELRNKVATAQKKIAQLSSSQQKKKSEIKPVPKQDPANKKKIPEQKKNLSDGKKTETRPGVPK